MSNFFAATYRIQSALLWKCFDIQLPPRAQAEMSSEEGTSQHHSSAPEIPNAEDDIPQPDVNDVLLDEAVHNRSTFFIEPAVLLLVFGLNLSGTVFKNQVIYQTCTSVFLYSENVCSLLGTANSTPESKKVETEIQPYVAKIFLAKIILENVVPALGGLFFGAWSDKNGRKPLLVAAFIGYSLIYIIVSVICYLSGKYQINPWFYILSVIPESILGGNCVYRIAIFCYTADITTAKQRPLRMALLEASIYIGLMGGSFAASYIYALTNSFTIFTISASIIVLTTFYIVLFVPESLKRLPAEPDATGQNQNPAQNQNPICEMLQTCFKPRDNRARPMVLLIISTLFITIFIISGVDAVYYLFVRQKFQWSVRDYTIYETIGTLVPILGNILGMLVMRKMFNVSVTTLALLAIGSSTLNALAKGLAAKSWHLYFAVGLGVFKAVGSPMCRAIVSNLVPSTDLGKIFSFTNVVESVAPFTAASLYTFLYTHTLSTIPGFFNLLSTGLYLVCFIFMAIIFGIKHSNPTLYGSTL